MVLAYWRERQGIIRRVVSKFCLDVSSLKSEGLMGNPTRVNTEHIQAYNRPEEESIAWWSLWFHWIYMVDSTATVNGLGEENLV